MDTVVESKPLALTTALWQDLSCKALLDESATELAYVSLVQLEGQCA